MEQYGGEKAVVPQVECEWSSLSPYLQEFIGEESDVELHDRFAELFTENLGPTDTTLSFEIQTNKNRRTKSLLKITRMKTQFQNTG